VFGGDLNCSQNHHAAITTTIGADSPPIEALHYAPSSLPEPFNIGHNLDPINQSSAVASRASVGGHDRPFRTAGCGQAGYQVLARNRAWAPYRLPSCALVIPQIVAIDLPEAHNLEL